MVRSYWRPPSRRCRVDRLPGSGMVAGSERAWPLCLLEIAIISGCTTGIRYAVCPSQGDLCVSKSFSRVKPGFQIRGHSICMRERLTVYMSKPKRCDLACAPDWQFRQTSHTVRGSLGTDSCTRPAANSRQRAGRTTRVEVGDGSNLQHVCASDQPGFLVRPQ